VVYNWVYNCLFPLLKSISNPVIFTNRSYSPEPAGNPQPSDGFNQAPPVMLNMPLLDLILVGGDWNMNGL
jgi:hypothetical protein